MAHLITQSQNRLSAKEHMKQRCLQSAVSHIHSESLTYSCVGIHRLFQPASHFRSTVKTSVVETVGKSLFASGEILSSVCEIQDLFSTGWSVPPLSAYFRAACVQLGFEFHRNKTWNEQRLWYTLYHVKTKMQADSCPLAHAAHISFNQQDWAWGITRSNREWKTTNNSSGC